MSRRLGLSFVIALVAVASMLALLGGSSAAASLNVSGTWNSVYDCSIGCAGEAFPDAITLKQAQGSATVTGTDQASATLAGTLSGSALSLTLTEGSYTAYYDVTISANGDSWSGNVSDNNGTSGTDTATKAGASAPVGPPVLAKSGSAKAVSGTVLIEAPGSDTFSPLTSTSKIAMGSTINATNGNVAIIVAKPGGGTETADFYDGEFQLTQAHNGFATEKLEGGNFAACTASGPTGPSGPTGASGPTGTSGPTGASGTQGAAALAVAATASTKTKVVRELWGHDTHGKFTTSGRGGAATVLGTIWLTEDLCEGTLFKAVKDSITVTDFAHPSQKHVVAQGHSFLALLRGS